MLPWFWLWAPQVHWPFSGDVAQDIAPDTRWFFNAIPPEAGVGRLEQKIFETHSYGRQLGVLTAVLLDLAERTAAPQDAQAQQRLEALKAMCEEIEQVKAQHAGCRRTTRSRCVRCWHASLPAEPFRHQ